MVTLPLLTRLVAIPEGRSPGSFQRFCGVQSGGGTGFCLNTVLYVNFYKLRLRAVNLCSKGVDNAM